MSLYVFPILFALFVWWFSTGVIVYLDGLDRRTFRWTVLGMTGVLAGALYGLSISAVDASVTGAYTAFTCGLLAWGWQEVAFLMGPMTGPRKQPCPAGSRGFQRVVLAIQTILYHEIAILVCAAVVTAITWDAPNQVGTWTFMILWAMRQSAKLNVFLGVPNLSEEFLPEHLRYLTSFLSRKPMNLLFPVSITLSMVAVVLLAQLATAVDASPFSATGYTFLATMVGLAILEHWFLVIPLPATALWRWSLQSHPQADAPDRHTAEATSL
jgi:putative photosynthetic complex assembly protein 2